MAASLRDFTFGDPQLAEFASLAEEHRSLHPSIPLAQLRNYVERLADMVRPTSDFAPRERGSDGETFFDYLKRLQPHLPSAVARDFHLVRDLGNAAAHGDTK